ELIAGHGAGVLGVEVIIWFHAVLLGAAALAVLPLPDIAQPPPRAPAESPSGDVAALLKIPAFRRLLLIAALVLGSHALHGTFAVIRWREAGIGTPTASVLWSESVGAEVVVFFVLGPPLLHRLGPAHALVLAAAAGAL